MHEILVSTQLLFFSGGCEEPVLLSESFIVTFQSAIEGATITYRCSPGLLPREQMSSVCTNMSWKPDPATLECTEPPPVEPGNCLGGSHHLVYYELCEVI